MTTNEKRAIARMIADADLTISGRGGTGTVLLGAGNYGLEPSASVIAAIRATGKFDIVRSEGK